MIFWCRGEGSGGSSCRTNARMSEVPGLRSGHRVRSCPSPRHVQKITVEPCEWSAGGDGPPGRYGWRRYLCLAPGGPQRGARVFPGYCGRRLKIVCRAAPFCGKMPSLQGLRAQENTIYSFYKMLRIPDIDEPAGIVVSCYCSFMGGITASLQCGDVDHPPAGRQEE